MGPTQYPGSYTDTIPSHADLAHPSAHLPCLSNLGDARVTMQEGPPTPGPHTAGRAWIGEPAILGYQIIR